MEKSPIFLGAVGSVNGETGVSLALNKDHARQRRALGYLFSNSALAKLEGIIQTHVQKLLAVLDKGASENQAVNVSDWCMYESARPRYSAFYLPSDNGRRHIPCI